MTSQLSTWTFCHTTAAGHATTEDYITAPKEAVKASQARTKFCQYMTPNGIYYTRKYSFILEKSQIFLHNYVLLVMV